RQHIGFASRRLSARRKSRIVMRTVTKGLVLRRPASTERHAIPACLAIEPDAATNRVGAGLAYGDQIDGRRRFVWPAILALIANGAGRASMRDLDKAFGIHGVGMNPRAFNVGEENGRCPRHAMAGVDAFLAFEQNCELLAFDMLYAVNDR